MKVSSANQRYWHIYVGSYSNSDQEGIHLLKFDSEEGTLKRLDGQSGIENPSFLTLDPEKLRLFSVSEVEDGKVVSYAIDPKSGQIDETNRRQTFGIAPCYLSLDEKGEWVSTVNYVGGRANLFPIESNGAIGPLADQVQHMGKSVNPERQEASHLHTIVNDPKSSNLFITDLGSDKIYLYGMDVSQGKWTPINEVSTAPGSGPRHITFHPQEPFLYVIHELDSTISVYSYDRIKGTLEHVQSVSTLPWEFSGNNTGADLHVSPSGQFLYGSNRGHDSIVTFKILENGTLETVGYTSTQGRTPRNFALIADGTFMLVANQDSDTIVVMKINDKGLPVPNGQVYEVAKPVCIVGRPFLARGDE